MNSLEKIKSEEYLNFLGPELSTKAIINVIRRTKEFIELRKDIFEGKIIDSEVQSFVKDLLFSNFKSGERFCYQLTLATLVICYKDSRSKFAREFLNGLASMEILEMSLASRIARECLK